MTDKIVALVKIGGSDIGCPQGQKYTLKGLGLTKVNNMR